jgi:protein gp37
MAATTEIAWADGTVNFWIGCSKVSPACQDCYAIPIASDMGIGWGDDAPRHRTSEGLWNAPLHWHAMRDRGLTHMTLRGARVPIPLWVFGNSLSDFFDNQVLPYWRKDAWTTRIRPTSLLRWILLTKRVSNVLRMLPRDWNGGRNYRHVGIVASIGDQNEFDRDLPRLIALKAHGVRWIGVSIEPQLGPVSITGDDARMIDWIITGGESAHAMSRKFDLAWPRLLIEQCPMFGIPLFVKQLGSAAFDGARRFHTRHSAGADASEWPPDLRVQQMPRVFDHEEARINQPRFL